MSELTIQEALQTLFQGLGEFDSASVLINDWDLLNMSVTASPWVLVRNCTTIRTALTSQCVFLVYVIPVEIVVYFDDWDSSYNSFRAARQAILDSLVGNLVLGPGQEIVDITTGGFITPIYRRYNEDDNVPEELPILLTQQLNVTVSETD